jgi:hypothetical protein
MGQRVHRNDRLDEGATAGEIERGAERRGHHHSVDPPPFVRRHRRLADQKTRWCPPPPGDDHLGGRPERGARRPQDLGGRVPTEHPLVADEHEGGHRTQCEVELDVGADVHVGEDPAEAWPRQHAAGKQARRDRNRAPERDAEIHANSDDEAGSLVPSNPEDRGEPHVTQFVTGVMCG